VTTNIKGEIALAKVISDLTTNGFSVFVPLADYLSIDLIVVNSDMTPKRIQVKYKGLPKSGRIEVGFSSVVNGKRVPSNLDFVDAYAIYNPESDTIYYFPKSRLTGKQLSFRLSERKDSTALLGYNFKRAELIWEG
jgi:hypothetical protein